jgi:hypothetical protein
MIKLRILIFTNLAIIIGLTLLNSLEIKYVNNPPP